MRSLQILLNLESNAIKFSLKGQSVTIIYDYELEHTNSTSYNVKISVVVTGIGIADENKASIFKPFFKSIDPISKKFNAKSHGLGLSICKEIAQGLDGSVAF